jgi:hydroxymethylbilane synthase
MFNTHLGRQNTVRNIVIGSRKSNLALQQTHEVIEQLQMQRQPFTFDIKKIMTKGDRILDVTLSKVGGKGLFVKEIEQAMLDKEIDMAVHSMKDMPSSLPDGLVIACMPERIDYRDVLISRDYDSLEDLPKGAVVGTSSLRRGAQVLAKRPDLEVEPIRGNIETRLRKLDEEHFDAIILAAAGLQRMGWSDDIVTEYFTNDVCLPAVGQGALAIECRSDDAELHDLLSRIHDDVTFRTVSAERAFLRKLEGGCQTPIAAFAELNGDKVTLTGLVARPDGKIIYKETGEGTDPVALGESLANELAGQGAKEIVDKVLEELDS